ncbi:hypothetical protein LZ31DRAFT_300411 [Colletotrichum somersetense]|nr:hypothetical protein LZ31DRAFT_300411 [Colletotrichum somersetense]
MISATKCATANQRPRPPPLSTTPKSRCLESPCLEQAKTTRTYEIPWEIACIHSNRLLHFWVAKREGRSRDFFAAPPGRHVQFYKIPHQLARHWISILRTYPDRCGSLPFPIGHLGLDFRALELVGRLFRDAQEGPCPGVELISFLFSSSSRLSAIL